MAGSIKWFKYTTDNGDDFAILNDESNWEAVNPPGSDFVGTDTIIYSVPRNVRPRTATFSNADKTRNITIVVADPTTYSGLTPADSITDPIAGTGSLTLSRKTPEKIRLPFAPDTGLNDGDAT